MRASTRRILWALLVLGALISLTLYGFLSRLGVSREADPSKYLHAVSNCLIMYNLDHDGAFPRSLSEIAGDARYDPLGYVRNLLREGAEVDYRPQAGSQITDQGHTILVTVHFRGGWYRITDDGTVLGGR